MKLINFLKMSNLEILKTRAIIEIEGVDRKKFLQGLLTNDVNKVTRDHLIYAVMLNAQGRFLYDFFIFELDEKLMLDCSLLRRDEILQKLNFYKLRSQVLLKKNDEIKIFYSQNEQGFSDPRNFKMGRRLYSSNAQASEQSSYNFNRIALKIPEGEEDLTYEKSFILEFGFDDLNAIDYQKGCYVGQELTARTHYRGEIRKKIFHVKIEGIFAVEKNSEITCEGKSAGIILSSVFHENATHALALLKDSQEINFGKLELSCQKILIID